MKIIQTFKCYVSSIEKKKSIDFEITKYQQTKWFFKKDKISFIESSLHWNMILFYLYQNQDNTKISYFFKYLKDKYYSFSIDFQEIDVHLETILFTFFYQDMNNNNIDLNKYLIPIDNKIKITYEWNNLYMDLIHKTIENEHKFIYLHVKPRISCHQPI